ncbi:MAG: hypothetical protein GFH27_549291n152 [Chloroflexi bacterium AL-W]|nr:hypothetical protein [Chloroflexi bacterium AL-N1]NOK67381.1 hypothetical protein [Chloroflexi bacterium AL-N10]NOK75127.1 hypothetical protein [Chloroflexi bacterium AL-N5]NOK81914.1 hypothetical protein [Chloroflexi bacterium AL-W]NOK89760.1 hypothetical protein [Chloroflexi bacterium AL-N15]
MSLHTRVGVCSFLVVITACATPSEEATQPTQPAAPISSSEIVVDLVHPEMPTAVQGQEGWEYQRTAFDGDGAQEQALQITHVPLFDGLPAWNDGHT